MKRLEEQLTALVKPSVDLPLHRARLRQALLHSSPSRFGSFTSFTMSFSKLLPASLALVLVFGLAFTFRSEQVPDLVSYVAPDASAEELVEDTLDHLKTLSEDQMNDIAQNMGLTSSDDIFNVLTGAKNAQDLSFAERTVLDCSTAQSLVAEGGLPGVSFVLEAEENSCASAFKIHFGPDEANAQGYDRVFMTNESVSVLDEAQFVQYTSENGYRVGLAITPNFEPIMTEDFTPDVVNIIFQE